MDTKPNLQIIIGSTRPSRKGPLVAEWFVEFARKHDKFDIELVDLADFNLPIMDEPNHPRLHDYQFEHTKKWSAKITKADAFVFVTPEYDYFAPASLVNAIQYLSQEWKRKAAGIVSYGGISGGLRSAQSLKQLITSMGMMPSSETVAIPFFTQHITDNEQFEGYEALENASTLLLNDLFDWATALKSIRH